VTDPVRHLLSRLDRERSPVVTTAELKRWSAGAASFMMSAGILREIALAESITYDGCGEGCVITPDLVENPETGQTVGVHYCRRDGCGRITIDAAELRQWEPHFEALAAILAQELKLGASASLVVPDRIHLLGSLPTGGGPLDIFLGRGLTWDDAPSVIERADRLTASSRPVIIVMKDSPGRALWQRVRPELISLAEYASWNEAKSRVEFGSLSTALQSLRPEVPEAQWLTVSECATLLLKDVSGIDMKKAMSRVSFAGTEGKFRTNEKKGPARRIERVSFDAWRLEQRERDLDKDNDEDRSTHIAASPRRRRD